MQYASNDMKRVAKLPLAELDKIMLRGEKPDFAAISGFEWKGFNTIIYAPILGIRQFIKGFFIDSDGSGAGYNEPCEQRGLEGPWRAKPNPWDPKRFGFYSVGPVDPTSIDNRRLNALLLNYAQSPRNFAGDPTRMLRDYIVRVEPGSDELLLGEAYLAFPKRLLVGHFALERLRKSSFRACA